MSNATWLWIGSRELRERETGGECLRAPPSQRLPIRSCASTRYTAQVAGSSRAEERCGKSKHNSPHPEHNQLREGGVTRERKSQRHSERCRARFEILCAAVPEEGESKPRRGSKLHPIQKWQAQRQGQQHPSSAAEETDEKHRGSGYYTRRLESPKRSYGSEPRREDRDE